MIFHRSRRNLKLPKLKVRRKDKGFYLEIEARWLEDQTLAALALDAERQQWTQAGLSLELVET